MYAEIKLMITNNNLETKNMSKESQTQIGDIRYNLRY